MANTGLIVAGSRILASVTQSIAPLAVIKGADESIASSATLQNDDALFLTGLAANASYLFDCYLDYEGGTQGSSDLKWTWIVPSGGALRYQVICTDNTGAAITGLTLAGASVGAGGTTGAGNLRGVSMNGTLITSSAGTLQLQWSQRTSNATPTIVHAQSYLALWRVT